jgi:micrococcal nuclease
MDFSFPYPAALVNAILTLIIAQGGTYGNFEVIDKHARSDSRPNSVYITKAIDGDTFEIETGERIRLAEIDAPETGECYGEESRKALWNLLRGQKLRLIGDEINQDKFGRLLRIVQIDGELPESNKVIAQEYLVSRGFARSDFHGNRAYQSGIESHEADARAKDRGLWKKCKKQIKTKAEQAKWWVDEDVLPTDPTCTIKGNISASGHGNQYFTESCRSYTSIKISPKEGEAYFCTEKEAHKAGFTKSPTCT